MEEKNNSITYEQDWNTPSEPEYPKIISSGNFDEEARIQENEISKPEKKIKDSSKQLLITIQLILCIIIALVAFIIKAMGGDVYKISREWYYSQLNQSVIFDSKDEIISLRSMFGVSTNDEV